MAKKVKTILKLNLPAGEATPAPPVGPALGQHGLPIMDFIKEFNARTADQKGTLIPAVITVYENRSYEFIVKKPPVTEMIKKALGVEKGSSTPGRDTPSAPSLPKGSKQTAATLTETQVTEIAKQKMEDLNTKNLEAAKKIVVGTARSMGINIE